MERITTEKANALSEMGHKVTIITTEQQSRPIYYPLHPSIVHIPLEINYTANKNILVKSIAYFFKKKRHIDKLTRELYRIKPDICVSTMGNEYFFLYKIKDGSKKILENHFTKGYRMMQDRSKWWKIIDFIRSKQEEKIVGKYDKFVVLSHEDKQKWNDINNITVIPNFITLPDRRYVIEMKQRNKLLIAVGRLEYQKGLDRIIEACSLIKTDLRGWKIRIYGSGDLKQDLEKQINKEKLQDIISIHPPTPEIGKIYTQSRGLLFSSRYEGFGMVLIEAMSYGTPSISFTCPCGPKDIIQDGIVGILVPNNDIAAFANAIKTYINDTSIQEQFSEASQKRATIFSREEVMKQWSQLFKSLLANDTKAKA